MTKAETKQLIRLMQEQIYEEMRFEFRIMGTGGHYTREQKSFVLSKTGEYGVRAIARILEIPRRTIQRWCRKYGVYVKRCPDWVYDWAERRRKRRAFWERRGYSY